MADGGPLAGCPVADLFTLIELSQVSCSGVFAPGHSIAWRFGIIIKALRHDGKAGLIGSVRDHHGWHSHGQVEREPGAELARFPAFDGVTPPNGG